MHYSNQQLEAELQKIAVENNSAVNLPNELPADTFKPLPEVEEFVREYREYQEQTANLDIGTY